MDVRVNADETHDKSDKDNVAQVVPNDATTDTANDTTQEVGAVLATVTVETPQEAVEVREVLERGDRVGPTVEKFKFKYFELPSDRMLLPYNHRGGEAIRAACKHVLGHDRGPVQQLGGDGPVQLLASSTARQVFSHWFSRNFKKYIFILIYTNYICLKIVTSQPSHAQSPC